MVENNGFLGREMFFERGQKRKIERVDIPELDGHIFVRSLTGGEMDQYEESRIRYRGKGRKKEAVPNFANARAAFVALVACDVNGNAIFTPADVAALSEVNAAALDRIHERAKAITGINDDDLEMIEKNSEGVS